MTNQDPSQPTTDISQSTTQFNPEKPFKKKTNVWILCAIVFITVIILEIIFFLFSENKKPITKNNTNSQNPTQSSFSLIPTPLLYPQSHSSTASGTFVTSISDTELLVTNLYGKQIGFKGSNSFQQIANAHIQKQPTGNGNTTVPAYTLPTDLYTLLITGKKTETIAVDVFGGINQFEIRWLPVTKRSKDLLTIDSSNRAISIKTAGKRKKYGLNLVIGGTNRVTKIFTINNLTIAKGEEEIFAASKDENSLRITNKAQTQNIQVTVAFSNGTGSQKTIPIYINDGDSVTITLSDWSNPGGAQIGIKYSNGLQ